MAGYVYLIGTPKFQWYKIGKSANASIRVRDLGILLPFKIEVIAIWKAANHHELEALLHDRYATYRINGEWFNFTAAQVKEICNDLALAQVSVLAAFTNMEKDCDALPKNLRLKGGLKYRIGKLTKQKAELESKLVQ